MEVDSQDKPAITDISADSVSISDETKEVSGGSVIGIVLTQSADV